MVIVKNLEDKDLELPFKGFTYFFPKGVKTQIDEDVAERIREVWPLAFEFDLPIEKGEKVDKVGIGKTKSYYSGASSPVEDMRATKAGNPVSTFNPEEGLSESGYYGAGLEEDDLGVK